MFYYNDVLPSQEAISEFKYPRSLHPIEKVVKKVVWLQLQRLLEEVDYLYLFKSSFRCVCSMNIITLVNDLWWSQNVVNTSKYLCSSIAEWLSILSVTMFFSILQGLEEHFPCGQS